MCIIASILHSSLPPSLPPSHSPRVYASSCQVWKPTPTATSATSCLSSPLASTSTSESLSRSSPVLPRSRDHSGLLSITPQRFLYSQGNSFLKLKYFIAQNDCTMRYTHARNLETRLQIYSIDWNLARVTHTKIIPMTHIYIVMYVSLM